LESINASWRQTHGHVNGSIWNGLFIVPQAADTKKGGKCQVVIFLPREKLNFLAHKYLFKLKLCDSPFRPSSNFVYHFPCYCGNILHDFMEPAIELLFPRLLIYNVCKTYKNTFRIKILCIFFSLTDICTRFVTL